MNYRPEIDGLRAIAVMLVVVFHAGIPGVPGGYIGVDVFFVISGHLITTIIVGDQAQGRFSLARFYERRVRRILPALFTVMTACLVAGLFWMWPYEFRDTGESVLAASAFVSNFYFWQEIDYFNPQAEFHPLLHTWSLAVEEQFYILFPLLMMLCAKVPRPTLIGLLAVIAVLSLAFAQWGGNLSFQAPYVEEVLSFQAQPSLASFYLPAGRAWELLTGCVVALVLFRKPQPRANDLLGLAGLALIVGAALTYDAATVFPSLWTVPPVAGTALLILFVNADSRVGRLLSGRVPVAVGLASYSIYLWHVPVYVFARILAPGEIGHGVYAALIALSVVLGFLSWWFVERPFRIRGVVPLRRLVLIVGLVWAVLIFAAAAIVASDGYKSRYAETDWNLVAVGPGDHGAYVNARFWAAIGGPFPPEAARKVLVIGDSFAADIVNMGTESGAFADSAVATLLMPARCQIFLGDDEGLAEDGCAAERRHLERADALIAEADVIILAAAWRMWAVERLPETIRRLGAAPDATILVMGSKALEKVDPARFLDMPADARAAYRSPPPAGRLIAPSAFAGLPPSATFVDTQSLICGGGACPAFTADGRLLSYDGAHLTRAGARFAGTRVFADPRLRALFPGGS